MEDIIYNFKYINEDIDVQAIPEKSFLGYRRFSIFSFMTCEALIFSVEDLKKMGIEFPEATEILKRTSEKQLWKLIRAQYNFD